MKVYKVFDTANRYNTELEIEATSRQDAILEWVKQYQKNSSLFPYSAFNVAVVEKDSKPIKLWCNEVKIHKGNELKVEIIDDFSSEIQVYTVCSSLDETEIDIEATSRDGAAHKWLWSEKNDPCSPIHSLNQNHHFVIFTLDCDGIKKNHKVCVLKDQEFLIN